MFHELIDKENPKCLFCKSECDIKLDGLTKTSITTINFNVEILTCRSCNEVFEIYSEDDMIGDLVYTAFQFSCEDICVLYDYDKSVYIISKPNMLWENLGKSPTTRTLAPEIKTPPFEIDFSNKKKLYKKLKTYVTFS